VKRPAFHWYPGDHRRDTAVQACSFEARALWREMIDLMHDGEPYGHLTAGGDPIDEATLASMVRVPEAKLKTWLGELERRKVFSRTDAGVINSRRMVRDEHHRNVRGAGGVKSLDNPNVPRPRERIPSGHPSTDPPGGPSGGPLRLRSADAVAVASALNGGSEEREGSRRAASPAPLALADSPNGKPTALAREVRALSKGVELFFDTFYAGKSAARQDDVARQILDSLTPQGAKLDRKRRVCARSRERLDAKCRELVNEAHTLRDQDKAMRVLLQKLGDTSDGSAPGQVAERRGVHEREAERAVGERRLARALAWLPAEHRAEIEQRLRADGVASIAWSVTFNAAVIDVWKAAGEPAPALDLVAGALT
jgi:hypothetical protein